MSGTYLDPCAMGACVAPAEFVRLRYFFGQRLGVVDLADEQSYLAGKQRFHNLRAHGTGVLCGLDAARYVYPRGADPAMATTLLRVRRGAALDACGREIVVGWEQCIDVAAWYAQHPAAHPAPDPNGAIPTSLRLWVALCYRECPSDPAPAPRDPCGCDAGGCEFGRVREGFELKLLTDAEAALVAAAARPVAGLDLVPEEVLGGSMMAALAREAALLAGLACPEPPTDPCLLLANFIATLDGSGAAILDIAAPDNAIPERLSQLSTAVLQQALLGALAASGERGLLGSGPRFAGVTFGDGTADAGTLSIGIEGDDGGLARDPFAAPAQLTVSVSRFKDDGDWEAAEPASTTYVAAPTPHLELQWNGGLIDGGRYRIVLQGDRARPTVDARMRPLTPAVWARHFRLVKDGGGNLILAGSLF